MVLSVAVWLRFATDLSSPLWFLLNFKIFNMFSSYNVREHCQMNLVKSDRLFSIFFFFYISLCENRKCFHRKLFNIIYIWLRIGQDLEEYSTFTFFLLILRLNYVGKIQFWIENWESFTRWKDNESYGLIIQKVCIIQFIDR